MNVMVAGSYKFKEDGAALVSSNSQIEVIAQQCPKAGGSAVYKARSIMKYFKDSTIYNDRYTCFQQGYYRAAATTDKTKYPLAMILPNPARETITLLHQFEIKAGTNFIITDLLNRTMLTFVLPEGNRESEFNISQLSNGFYLFRIINDKETLAHGKFAISR